MNLRKKAETNSDITLEWDPVAGAVGYRFQSSASTPKWSHTFDSTRTSIKFSKSDWYKVQALDVTDEGVYPSVTPPPPPTGARFTADFEDGTFDVFKMSDGFAGFNTHKIQIVQSDGTMQPRRGNYFARMEIGPGDVAPWSSSLNVVGLKKQPMSQDVVGSDVYMGFSFALKPGFVLVQNMLFNIFMEWHGDNDFQAPFKLIVNMGNPPNQANAQWAMELNTQYPGDHIYYNLGPVVYGQWVDFVVHHKWSTGSDGLFEGWMNGVKKFSRSGKTWQAGQNKVFLQAIYYRPVNPSVNVWYYDEIRVGSSYEAVAP